MTEPFDPYYIWLGIPPSDQPPHAYRLLGVEAFEPNLIVIENAADRQMAHVRVHQSGRNAAHSQALLNEISAARTCLLDSGKKAAYDEQLRAVLYKPAAERFVAAPPPPAQIADRLSEPPIVELVAVSSLSSSPDAANTVHAAPPSAVPPVLPMANSALPAGPDPRIANPAYELAPATYMREDLRAEAWRSKSAPRHTRDATWIWIVAGVVAMSFAVAIVFLLSIKWVGSAPRRQSASIKTIPRSVRRSSNSASARNEVPDANTAPHARSNGNSDAIIRPEVSPDPAPPDPGPPESSRRKPPALQKPAVDKAPAKPASAAHPAPIAQAGRPNGALQEDRTRSAVVTPRRNRNNSATITPTRIMVGGSSKDLKLESKNHEVMVSGVEHRLTITGPCRSLRISGNDHVITIDEVGEISVSGSNNLIQYRGGLEGKTPNIRASSRSRVVKIK